MMKTYFPKISIVTPSFNRGWSIRSCIQSLQSQTFVDYEHIIVDGGSTDGTLDILHEVASADLRIRFISESDSGMYDAVNKGLHMASADIVTYLNTDDFYFPQTLERVIKAFTDQPNISMLYGHWMSWHPETNFLEMLPVLNYAAADLAVFAVLPQPSVFFRRKVFKSLGGFDLSYKLLADNDFFSKAAVSGFKFVRIDDYLSIQTVHSGNLLAGNQAAILQAQHEGERYRLARKDELSYSEFNSSVITTVATCKKALLPFVWRCHLIYRLFLRGIPNSAEFRSRLLSIGGANFSLCLLFRYLVGRGARQKFAYFKVEQSFLSKCLGILLHDDNTLPTTDTFRKDR